MKSDQSSELQTLQHSYQTYLAAHWIYNWVSWIFGIVCWCLTCSYYQPVFERVRAVMNSINNEDDPVITLQRVKESLQYIARQTASTLLTSIFGECVWFREPEQRASREEQQTTVTIASAVPVRRAVHAVATAPKVEEKLYAIHLEHVKLEGIPLCHIFHENYNFYIKVSYLQTVFISKLVPHRCKKHEQVPYSDKLPLGGSRYYVTKPDLIAFLREMDATTKSGLIHRKAIVDEYEILDDEESGLMPDSSKTVVQFRR